MVSSSTLVEAMLDWEKYALSWDGGESGDVSESLVPSTGEGEREHFPDPFQKKLLFFLWNCCRVDFEPSPSVAIEGGCEVVLLSSPVFPDQLKTPRPNLAGREWEGLDDSSLTSSSLACSSKSGSSHKDGLSSDWEFSVENWGESCFIEASCVSATADSPRQKNLTEMNR